jgi:hypothetical protein
MKSPILLAACAGCLLAAHAGAQVNAGSLQQEPLQVPAQTQTQMQMQAPMPAAAPANAPLTRAQVREALAHARADGEIPRFGNPPGR